jgi:hypothetical protein
MPGASLAMEEMMTNAMQFPSEYHPVRTTPIRLAAPTPAFIVEWPTGVFYGNHEICPCCEPSEGEGFVVFLPNRRGGPRWSDLCTATEAEALALVEVLQEWANHRVRNLEFHAHPGNRYCWHRCSFDLEFWPTSLAFPSVEHGRFQGWLAWPWVEWTGFDPRPWGTGKQE